MSTLLNKILLFSGGGAAALGLKTNLIAWWELDEASGNRADSHTNALTLTDVNTVTSNTGVGGVGTAALFASPNTEYLFRADGTEISMGDLDFTIAGWFYLTADPGADAWVFCKGPAVSLPTVAYGLVFNNTNNLMRFSVGNGTTSGSITATTVGTPADATWYFFCAQHDSVANTIHLQINTTAQTPVSYAGGSYDEGEILTLGRQGALAVNYWHGRMAKIAIWKSAAGAGGVLSAAQITALYNGGAGLSYAQLT